MRRHGRHDERHGRLDGALGVLGIIILGLAIAGALWLGRALLDRQRPSLRSEPESPREILSRRYAAGEIDEDEYFRRTSGLDQS